MAQPGERSLNKKRLLENFPYNSGKFPKRSRYCFSNASILEFALLLALPAALYAVAVAQLPHPDWETDCPLGHTSIATPASIPHSSLPTLLKNSLAPPKLTDALEFYRTDEKLGKKFFGWYNKGLLQKALSAYLHKIKTTRLVNIVYSACVVVGVIRV